MSELVAPAVVLETENDIDPGTEMPYQEASAANIEVAEQDENKEESQEDQNKEMSEEEKMEKEEEKWKKRERDFFAFRTPETETPDDRPLVGRELIRELALHKKMRSQVLEQIKKLRDVPYMKNLILSFSRDPTLEDVAARCGDHTTCFNVIDVLHYIQDILCVDHRTVKCLFCGVDRPQTPEI